MRINLGSWEPDVADFGTDTLDIARNAYPGVNSWLPAPGLVTQSNAIVARPKGLFHVRKTDGTYATYAGTATKLYRFNKATLNFDDVSRLADGNYAVPADSYWSGTQAGNWLILCQLGDVPQYIDIDSGTNFAALPGSPPTAKFVTMVQDRVMFAHLSTDPNAIQWSDSHDFDDYSTGLSGDQTFASGGAVQAVCGAAGLIIQETGIRGIVPTGGTDSFQFPEIASTKGTLSPYAVIEIGSLAFWLSEDGFYVGNSAEQRSISHRRVSKYFFDQINRDRLYQVYGGYDPYAPRVIFSYPSGATEYNDRALVYDWALDKWGELVVDTYLLGRTATVATSIEAVDNIAASVDALTISLDSRTLMGGAPVLAAFNTTAAPLGPKLCYFEGDNLAATFETANYQLTPGWRSRVRRVMPFVEGTGGASVTVGVAKRQRLSDAVPAFVTSAVQTSGWCPLNADGFIHKFQMNIPAAADWDHAQGMVCDYTKTSQR
jgi:hypothetical protein